MSKENPNVMSSADRFPNRREDMADKSGEIRQGIAALIDGNRDQLERISAALNHLDGMLIAFASLVKLGKRPSTNELDAMAQLAIDIGGTVQAQCMNVSNLVATIDASSGVVGAAMRGLIRPLS